MLKNLKGWLKYLLPFTAAVLIYAFITQYEQTVLTFNKLFGSIGFMVGRFAIGFGLAYFLNFPMRYLEKKLKFRRWMSISVTYLILVLLIFLMIMFVVPSMVESIQQILNTSQTYYQQIQELLNTSVLDLPEEAAGVINDVLKQAADGTMSYLRTLLAMDVLGQFVSKSVRTMIDILFGMLISFYVLWSKEALVHTVKRTIFALFRSRTANGIMSVSSDADNQFSKYLIGKIWDSVIVGVVCFIAYKIFGLPVSVFLAVVAGVTNMVPYFGPIAGGVITGIILLGFNPGYMLTGVLIFIAVLALDGAIIEPKILSDVSGLSPLLIIISITIGGDLFGLWGILLAVPVVGTFKNSIVDKILNYRLKSKGLNTEEPDKPDDPDEQIDGQIGM